MTLMEHLAELRHRIIVCVIAILAGGVIVYFLYDHVIATLLHPYCQILKDNKQSSPGGCLLYVRNPIDLLTNRIKVATFGGIAIALPVILWQLWRFITPGLHANERKYAVPFVLASCFFFLLGGFVAYETFPLALRFFHSVGGSHVGTILDPNAYIGLVILLIAVYGVGFEFPVVLVALQLAHVVTSAKLRKWRRGAIIGSRCSPASSRRALIRSRCSRWRSRCTSSTKERSSRAAS
jgi:sec-independent protein translocase protein TatC